MEYYTLAPGAGGGASGIGSHVFLWPESAQSKVALDNTRSNRRSFPVNARFCRIEDVYPLFCKVQSDIWLFGRRDCFASRFLPEWSGGALRRRAKRRSRK